MPICEVGRRSGWCGACYEGLRGRVGSPGHGGPLPCRIKRLRNSMSRLQKPSLSSSPPGPTGGAPPSGFASAYPALTEFLSMPFWADGTSRTLGTMMILYEEGRWRCWVNCKATARSAWLSAATVEALLACVESGLEQDSLEWRRARPERASRGK